MRIRHKTPTLVSMWMLDVFCCALGCVTLLFLLDRQAVTDAEDAQRRTVADLDKASKRLAAELTNIESLRVQLTKEEEKYGALSANLADLQGKHSQLKTDAEKRSKELEFARTERDETGKKLAFARDEAATAKALLDSTELKLATAEKKADITAKELTAARAEVADATDLLKKKQKDLDALMKKDSASALKIEDLMKLVRDKDADRLRAETSVTAAKKELTDVEARLKALQRELDSTITAAKAAAKAAADELATAKVGAAKTADELGTAKAQIKDLTKKLDDANTVIIDLQGDKARLADKFNKIDREKESRFAGIAMTGKKAVFLVDMSGSMGKRDLNTVDNTKWPLVIETVCKVMRSIPTLESYQVIVFSSGANWVFGNGEWQTFNGEKSIEAVNAALLKVKPKDDTNVYAALDKAFSLRSVGLDTIYLFSDGLPTSGPGLTPAQERANLSEPELGAILGKHVRDKLKNDWNRAAPGGARVKINSVGFYFDSPDVGAFLWSLSRENDGSFVGMSKP